MFQNGEGKKEERRRKDENLKVRRGEVKKKKKKKKTLLGEHSRQTPPVALSADEDGWRFCSGERWRDRVGS